jgi:hypothetical protein
LAGELGKLRMYPRRFTVLDGMAENAVLVHVRNPLLGARLSRRAARFCSGLGGQHLGL